jgi:hypothetical protein
LSEVRGRSVSDVRCPMSDVRCPMSFWDINGRGDERLNKPHALHQKQRAYEW